MVSGGQSIELDDDTRSQLEQNQVPEELIAQFEEPEQDQPTVVVLFEHITAFWLFYRNLNRWLYVNRPVGMGTLSVHDQWDWQAAERTMQRLPEVRSMDAEQLDELYLQLEVMESQALKVFHQQFKQLVNK